LNPGPASRVVVSSIQIILSTRTLDVTGAITVRFIFINITSSVVGYPYIYYRIGAIYVFGVKISLVPSLASVNEGKYLLVVVAVGEVTAALVRLNNPVDGLRFYKARSYVSVCCNTCP
jgi:hypothetical protein